MKINKKNLLSKLKSDLTMADPSKGKLDLRRREWIREYEGQPYGNERKGKATIVSRDIKKAASWQHASVIEPFVSSPNMIKCDPITHEDENAASQAEVLLNFQFTRDFNHYRFISLAFKVLQREGTVVARVGWEYEEEEKEVEAPVYSMVPITDPAEYQMAQMQGRLPFKEIQTGVRTEIQTVIKKNRPTVEVCKNQMLWIDPTADNNIDDAQFVIYKFKSNLSELKQDGKYKNLDQIKSGDDDKFDEKYYQYDEKMIYDFSDDARREVDVYEYWGNYDVNGDGIAEPIVCTWVEDTIIRLQENPYPDKQIPFVSCAFDAEPFSVQGLPNAELLSTDQKIKTGIMRAMLDTLDASTNGQKGIKKGTLDPLQLRKFKQGEDFEFIGSSADIWNGAFNQIPDSVLKFYGLISEDIDSLTGVKAFGVGSSGSKQSATAISGAIDATAKREADISRNFKDNFLVPILRKWLSMNAVFLDEEQVVRVTNKQYVPIRRDDLDGNVDINIDVSTAETDQAKAQELSFMLQTMGPNLPMDMTNMILAEIADLKKMPGLAEKIRNYQPQPDPIAEEMKRLELEKLQAEVEERRSRAYENKVDMDLKSAKAENERAKARGTHSKADLDDQTFLDKEDGLDLDREMALNDQKATLDFMSKANLQGGQN